MKQIITKSDGTPTKSKVFAIKFLQEKGIDESCLIQENGQFFYEDAAAGALTEAKAQSDETTEETPKVVEEVIEEAKEVKPIVKEKQQNDLLPVTWETPVYDKDNAKTILIIPGTDIKATINAKHPGGQIRPTSAFEIAIGQENFIMSLDLVSKLFRVRGVLRT